jgi:hypothetical protein
MLRGSEERAGELLGVGDFFGQWQSPRDASHFGVEVVSDAKGTVISKEPCFDLGDGTEDADSGVIESKLAAGVCFGIGHAGFVEVDEHGAGRAITAQ